MTVKEQAAVLARAWEGGAFDEVRQRWARVSELRVASCTEAQLVEAVAASNAIRDLVESLLGEPVKAGLCNAFAFSTTTRGISRLLRPLDPGR